MLTKDSHISVLKQEVLTHLITEQTKSVFDGTLGLGGHAELILSHYPKISHYIGTDLDKQHLNFAQKRLKKFPQKKHLRNQNFSSIQSILEDLEEIPRPLSILLDLGLCSNQIDDPTKGFSFIQDGPLHMGFSDNPQKNAEEIINEYSTEALAHIFYQYGEERFSRRIAKKIVESREKRAIKTTNQLKNIIESITHHKSQKKTLMRIFQAIRIEVNDELGQLQKTLEDTTAMMQAGDRFGVMSFHSLEDRMVKKFFQKKTKPKTIPTNYNLHEIISKAPFTAITKSPITPNKKEEQENTRSRSVKFRIIEKT